MELDARIYLDSFLVNTPKSNGSWPLPYGVKKFDCLHIVGTIEQTKGGGAWLSRSKAFQKHLSSAPIMPKIDCICLDATVMVENERSYHGCDALQVGRLRGFFGRDIKVSISAEEIVSNRELRSLLLDELMTAPVLATKTQGHLIVERICPDEDRLQWIVNEYMTRDGTNLLYDLDRFDLSGLYDENFVFYNHYVEVEHNYFLGYDNYRVIRAKSSIKVVSFDHLDEPIWFGEEGWYVFKHPIPNDYID